MQDGELDVLGTKVVAPLGDAVRLVDGEQGEAGAGGDALQEAEEARRQQPFRRHVEQVEPPATQRRVRLRAASSGDRAEFRYAAATPRLLQRCHLVVHQGDQRRDDDAHARRSSDGNLVAQRLAATRRHEHQGIAAGHDMVDDLRLLAAELPIAKHGPQYFQGGWGHRCCPRR